MYRLTVGNKGPERGAFVPLQCQPVARTCGGASVHISLTTGVNSGDLVLKLMIGTTLGTFNIESLSELLHSLYL